jgi:hypothetical protein
MKALYEDYFEWAAICVGLGFTCFVWSFGFFVNLDGGHEPWSWPTTLAACAGAVLVLAGILTAVINGLKLVIRRVLQR